MLDIKFIRANPEIVKTTVQNKNGKLNVDELLEVDAKRTELIQQTDELRTKRNQIADKLKDNSQRTPELIEEGKKIKAELQKLEVEQREVETKYTELMYITPQIPSNDTPVGKTEADNVEIKKWGEVPQFDFEIKDHIQLGKDLDLLDIERGVRTSGYRGYYLKNEAVLLHMGLMMYGLQKMVAKGYTPFVPPTLVRDFALFGSGHFPMDKGTEIFEINNPDKAEDNSAADLYLAGTSEPSMLAYHTNETFKLDDLPKKYCGFSQCYRSEIGSYGKDTRGIYRLHEFMKIEQIIICEADYDISTKYQEEMLAISEEIMQELELPYRIIQLCTGDMGIGKYRMFDIETWMPSRDSYGETHSASNLGDWQARRLNTKYIDKDGKKQFVHMLNNTAVASPRILIAILELNQQKDGSIKVPKVLQGYVGKDLIGR
ncbi:serine--tRNA ligase [Candidatus Dojkabacteria bacterium]|uniref:Serine--tRNA ligase n=1 Tax=Candidatus Dojkabacteria bacterium TaxID=2099670 RepID=A0A955L3J5_9BACT|nr:serine--tRNA ligase [Candidatus Dojkabacteria bacterium]